jgi:HK97 family phage portal protein
MAAEPHSRALKLPGKIKSAMFGLIAGWYGRNVILGDPFKGLLTGTVSNAGERVTVNSTLQLSTAWACTRLISESIATMPFNTVRYDNAGKKPVRDTKHQVYQLLHTQPNADMTAVSFWQAFLTSLLLWGNAYVEKIYGGGILIALNYLHPDCVFRRPKTPENRSGPYVWEYTDPETGNMRIVPDELMWHTPAFSIDGRLGLSVIAYGTQVFGSAMAAERASAETFKNGMKSPGMVTVDSILKPGQRDEIREHVRKVSKEGGVMVFEKGGGYQALAMNPEDAQLLATQEFNVLQICSWFLVPPHMIGHTTRSTSWGTGIEQQMIGFVTFVLRPWCVRIEQSICKNLFTPEERMVLSAEFNLEGLLRGDSASRSAFYSSMTQNGVMTRNECRAKENLEPKPGNADELTVQSNMLPIDKLGEAATTPSATAQNALKEWLGLFDVHNGKRAARTEPEDTI